MKNENTNEGFFPLKITTLNRAATKPDKHVEMEQAILVYDPMPKYLPAMNLSMPPIKPAIIPATGSRKRPAVSGARSLTLIIIS